MERKRQDRGTSDPAFRIEQTPLSATLAGNRSGDQVFCRRKASSADTPIVYPTPRWTAQLTILKPCALGHEDHFHAAILIVCILGFARVGRLSRADVANFNPRRIDFLVLHQVRLCVLSPLF
jgi:hypothetical protein